MAFSFKIELDTGEIREFHLIQKFTLRFSILVQEILNSFENKEPTLLDIIKYVLSNETITNNVVKTAYIGNHNNINWFNDIDINDVTLAVSSFFLNMIALKKLVMMK